MTRSHLLIAALSLVWTVLPALGQGTSAASGGEEGLVLHLTFEDSAGVGKDSSGRGHHGKVLDAKSAPGKFGNALSFDGDNDAVDVGKHDDFNLDDKTSFTFSFWMQSTTSEKWSYVLTKKLRTEPTEPGFAFYINPSGQMCFAAADGQNEVRLAGSTKVTSGQWVHIAVVADRAGDMELYVDGQVEDRKPMTGLLDLTNPRRQFRIGDRDYDNDYKGLIDEVKLYRAANPAVARQQ